MTVDIGSSPVPLDSEIRKVDSDEVKQEKVGPKKLSASDMMFYYERLLPFRYVFQWLSHSPKVTKDFSMREFAYEFISGAYQRYNSYMSLEDFKKSVIKANPTRFEIGAVYTVNPRERRNVPKLVMKPLGKELVFDIDLTDYDDIRTCCKGTDICQKCWKFIQIAAKVIESALREDFGFEHLVWVFSGRRGAHCWVSDKRARVLDEGSRKAIIEYLALLGSLTQKGGTTLLNLKKPFHPHVERSFNILKQEFVSLVLEEQDPWLTDAGSQSENWLQVEELLSFIGDRTLQDELRQKWRSQGSVSTSVSKWEDINVMSKKVLKNQNQMNQLNDAKKDIIFFYMYPRLDIEVTKQVIHLLKSPFCIHPGTGNICVPFDPLRNFSHNKENDKYGFSPTDVPNLSQLQTELESWENKVLSAGSNSDEVEQNANKKLADFEKTSLKPYVDYFAKFVTSLLKEELKDISKREREDDDPLDY